MSAPGLVAFLLFLVVGGYLTWPEASEIRAARAAERRWLAEGGFTGPWALEKFNGVRVAAAVCSGLVVVPLLRELAPLPAAAVVVIAAFLAWALPTLFVDARRTGR